jgi:hypothetical protein
MALRGLPLSLMWLDGRATYNIGIDQKLLRVGARLVMLTIRLVFQIAAVSPTRGMLTQTLGAGVYVGLATRATDHLRV